MTEDEQATMMSLAADNDGLRRRIGKLEIVLRAAQRLQVAMGCEAKCAEGQCYSAELIEAIAALDVVDE